LHEEIASAWGNEGSETNIDKLTVTEGNRVIDKNWSKSV